MQLALVWSTVDRNSSTSIWICLCRATSILDMIVQSLSHAWLFLVPLVHVCCSKCCRATFFGLHTSCLKMKSTHSGPIRQFPLTWLIYSESYESSPSFYQLFHFTPKHLKTKFSFSGLIRQLLLTWPIYIESHEYCPFPIKS
jgi:hypothetical protein